MLVSYLADARNGVQGFEKATPVAKWVRKAMGLPADIA